MNTRTAALELPAFGLTRDGGGFARNARVCGERAAVALGWGAYALFYMTVAGGVFGVPVALAVYVLGAN